MASRSVSVLHVTLFLLMFCAVSSERMKTKIYDSVDGVAACFRRLNGTHQFGCTSRRSGNVGIVHIIEDVDDLNWLLNKGRAVPYMVVLHPEMFKRDYLLKLKDSGKINGIALVNGSYPESFSHEDTCPNRYSGLSSFSNQTCGVDPEEPEWNPKGTGLMMVDWGFPIFYVHSDYEKIEKCYNSFNSEGRNEKHNASLCAMEMNSFMFATVDSATCIRRSKMITNFNPMKFCDPLGGRNVWSTLFPRRKDSGDQNNTMFVVASRLDTSSLFDGIAPGAVSPITGIVTLLTTAHILASFNFTDSSSKNIFFALFNGESYDYIGSSRMVWDMQKGRFPSENEDGIPPLRLEHLAYFVELSHITNQYKVNDIPTLVFHSKDMNSVQSHLYADKFWNEMKKLSTKFGFQLNKSDSLPPASLQTFKTQGRNTDGVVIADYPSSYKTSYYHSIFDDKRALDYEYQEGNVSLSGDSIQGFVASVSIALAKTLYTMLHDSYRELPTDAVNETAIVHLVDELFYCYLVKMNCSIFQQVLPNAILSDKAGSLYVGVNSWRGPNYHVTTLTGHTLAYLTGRHINNKTEKECLNDFHDPGFQYFWMKGEDGEGVCVESTMNFSIASSPAFEEESYNWSSGLYSTWTESVWQELTVRVFLKPSASHEAKVFSIGAVIFGLSFIIVYFLNSRSHILFGNTLGTGAC